jgi:hypothetical protein
MSDITLPTHTHAIDRNPSGWRIENAMAVAMSLIASIQASDPDTDLSALQAALEAETDAVALLRRVIRAHIEADVFARACKARADQIEVRQKRYARLAEATRATAYAMLDALQLPGNKVVDPEFTASITPSNKSVVITDEDKLPAIYVKVETTPLKAEIAKALKAGAAVPGAELSNGIPTLTIRKL